MLYALRFTDVSGKASPIVGHFSWQREVTHMRTLRTLSDWLELCFLWIFVTGISWSVALVVALVLAQAVSPALSSQVTLLLGGVVVGALIGLAQWAVLRPDVRGVGFWTLATVIGWTAGLIVTSSVVRMAEPAPGGLIGGALGGFVWGLAQWLALRSETGGRLKWLLVTVVGWTVALALGTSLPINGGLGGSGGGLVDTAASGAVALIMIGIFAVLALPVLFPEPHQRAVDRRVRWWS
jgi:hypothetical protein